MPGWPVLRQTPSAPRSARTGPSWWQTGLQSQRANAVEAPKHRNPGRPCGTLRARPWLRRNRAQPARAHLERSSRARSEGDAAGLGNAAGWARRGQCALNWLWQQVARAAGARDKRELRLRILVWVQSPTLPTHCRDQSKVHPRRATQGLWVTLRACMCVLLLGEGMVCLLHRGRESVGGVGTGTAAWCARLRTVERDHTEPHSCSTAAHQGNTTDCAALAGPPLPPLLAAAAAAVVPLSLRAAEGGDDHSSL